MSQTAALAFFLATLPVAFWVAWSDMARMKIPNPAVMALVAVFLVLGPFLLPLADWGWRWLHLAVVLVVGFVMNMGGLIGAGDAKFAAAMAPFVALSDAAWFLVLFAAVLLAAFATHRGFRAVPAVRRLAADWQSWGRGDFPMGLALAGTLSLYLALAAFGAR